MITTPQPIRVSLVAPKPVPLQVQVPSPPPAGTSIGAVVGLQSGRKPWADVLTLGGTRL